MAFRVQQQRKPRKYKPMRKFHNETSYWKKLKHQQGQNLRFSSDFTLASCYNLALRWKANRQPSMLYCCIMSSRKYLQGKSKTPRLTHSHQYPCTYAVPTLSAQMLSLIRHWRRNRSTWWRHGQVHTNNEWQIPCTHAYDLIFCLLDSEIVKHFAVFCWLYAHSS